LSPASHVVAFDFPSDGVMSNVLQFFKTENPPDPKTIVAIAVASILSSKEQLARAIEELSKHLDAVGHTIDVLGDTDPQNPGYACGETESQKFDEGNARTLPRGRKIVG
jgi:hypothetical protein